MLLIRLAPTWAVWSYQVQEGKRKERILETVCQKVQFKCDRRIYNNIVLSWKSIPDLKEKDWKLMASGNGFSI